MHCYSYFWIKVLDIIAPPYSDEFVNLFLPVVQNEEITGSLRNPEKSDDVSTFIGKKTPRDVLRSMFKESGENTHLIQMVVLDFFDLWDNT